MFLPGESQGWGSLVVCLLWGRTDSDTTEVMQQQQQQVVLEVKKESESACNAGETGSISGSERSPGEENGNSLQYCLEIPWIKRPGKLQSIGLQRVGHNWATNTFTFNTSWNAKSPFTGFWYFNFIMIIGKSILSFMIILRLGSLSALAGGILLLDSVSGLFNQQQIEQSGK